MEFTGERYLPHTNRPEISYEHWHRYLYASQFVSGKMVLDVASGEGYGSSLLAETAKGVIGVDCDQEATDHASRKYRSENLEFRCGEVNLIPIEGRHLFDIIVSFETIEHVDQEAQLLFLKEIKRLLKPEGILLVSTPNKAVYSDKPNYRNQFHRKEFYQGEFLDVLGHSFRTVTLLGQKVFPVSCIWRADGAPNNWSEHQIAYSGGSYAPVKGNKKEILYLLAVCSDAENQVGGNSLLLDISERATHHRANQLAKSEHTLRLLEGQLADRDVSIQNLQVQCAEQSALSNRLANELTQYQTRIQELDAKLEFAHVLAKRSSTVIEQRDTTISDLLLQIRSIEVLRNETGMLRRVLEQQAAELDGFHERIREAVRCEMTAQIREIQRSLHRFEEKIFESQDEIHNSLCEMQSARVVSQIGSEDVGNRIAYRHTVDRIRGVINSRLPRGAVVVVVSKGDDELLHLRGRVGWHFPQTSNGVYAGYYPACDIAAIAHLEALRAKGAQYFLLPATMYWWFDHYSQFKQHLDQRYERVLCHDEVCMLYSLRELAAPQSTSVWSRLNEAVDHFEHCRDRQPTLLDWNTGLQLASRFPQHAVFEPPTADKLPYLEGTIDLVAVRNPTDRMLAEANRVTEAGVIIFSNGSGTGESSLSLEIVGRIRNDAATAHAVSIVITLADLRISFHSWLRDLQGSLPSDFRGEIVLAHSLAGDADAELRKMAEGQDRVRVLQSPGASSLALSNIAAGTTDSEILIFLDYETVPLPGWLPPLVRTFRDQINVGVVAARLLSPDGRLYEAGREILADGSTVMVGHGQFDCEAPEHNYVREVDCCSSAVLATRRSCFLKTGGFRTEFTTRDVAYADYCMKLRGQSLCAYYQPQSRVVQLQGNQCDSGEYRPDPDDSQLFRDTWYPVLHQRRSVMHSCDSIVAVSPGIH